MNDNFDAFTDFDKFDDCGDFFLDFYTLDVHYTLEASACLEM